MAASRPHQFVLAVLLLAPVSAVASGTNLAAELVEQGWEEIVFDGKTPNRYDSCGAGCVEIETRSSVSMIGKTVDVDISRQRWLDWEWRIEEPAVETDLTKKGGDDRSVAVYVGFEYDPDSASLSETLLRPFVELSQGDDAPGRGISYVWGGERSGADVFRNPYQKNSAAVFISRTAEDPTGEWLMESRDVVADYERAFGVAPTGVTHILISADSDDTGADNRAAVRNIQFRSG